MDFKQLIVLALKVSIICTVFGFGLRATLDDLLYVVRRPSLLARSLLAMMVVMPILAVLLVRAFDFKSAVEIALIALSVSPIPPLLPARQVKTGGLPAYALGLMAILGLVSIVLVPLMISALGRVLAQPLAMGPGAIAGVVLQMVLVPLALGTACHALAPGLANRLDRPIGTVANVLLVLAVLPLLVAVAPAVWNLIGDGTVLAIVLFVLAGLAVGHVLAGPDPAHAIVLALSTASRHPAIAFAIASTNFPEQRFGGVIILYLVVNAIVGIPYLAWQKRRKEKYPGIAREPSTARTR